MDIAIRKENPMDRKQTLVVGILCIFFLLACNAPFLEAPTPIPIQTATDTIAPTITLAPTEAPTFIATPMPEMIASGTIDIPQTYMADLDTGIVPRDPKNPALADVDLWFEAVSSRERYLEPYNGASMVVAGLTEVGYNECRSKQAAVSRVDINNLPAGIYICVITNINNVSVVRVNSINLSAPGSIRLDFKTWHQP
jgi:hypothetical protein